MCSGLSGMPVNYRVYYYCCWWFVHLYANWWHWSYPFYRAEGLLVSSICSGYGFQQEGHFTLKYDGLRNGTVNQLRRLTSYTYLHVTKKYLLEIKCTRSSEAKNKKLFPSNHFAMDQIVRVNENKIWNIWWLLVKDAPAPMDGFVASVLSMHAWPISI